MVEPLSSARSLRQYAVRKAFREDLPTTQNGVAPEAPYEDQQIYTAPTERQVGRATQIPTLNPTGQHATSWTCTIRCTRSNTDADAFGRHHGVLHNEAARHKAGRSKFLIHRADSLRKTEPEHQLSAAELSQSHYWKRKGGRSCERFHRLGASGSSASYVPHLRWHGFGASDPDPYRQVQFSSIASSTSFFNPRHLPHNAAGWHASDA
ncbi:hypothetical protein SAMN04488059_1296 [Devosia psychrophila]|uniref:Uncharacterized protein n=1 Tax=Devosia psychrophila TaxID=728005 RepID=A0A1I1QNY4_9HYPH|nr:hypothetical protein SAMN04488059_1296 [Devosia psychrophila]